MDEKNTFVIPKCKFTGCINWSQRKCWLHGTFISKWIDTFEYLDVTEECEMKRQIKIYKTRQLLEAQ